MIPYSLDNHIRRSVVVFIVLISMLLTLITDNIIVNSIPLKEITSIITNIQPYGIVMTKVLSLLLGYTIPVFVIFIILYKLYATLIWRINLLYKIHHVPNLDGEWDGTVKTIYRKENGAVQKIDGERRVKVTITQDWDKIRIKTHMVDSRIPSFCTCTVAAIDTRTEAIILKYAYMNTSAVNSNYVGYNELTLESNKLSGAYITTKPSAGYFEIYRNRK